MHKPQTFKSGDVVEGVDVIDVDMKYLYHDGEHGHFMMKEDYEQYEINEKFVGDAAKWLKEEDVCILSPL